jgi:hypothetical protein
MHNACRVLRTSLLADALRITEISRELSASFFLRVEVTITRMYILFLFIYFTNWNLNWNKNVEPEKNKWIELLNVDYTFLYFLRLQESLLYLKFEIIEMKISHIMEKKLPSKWLICWNIQRD